MKTVAGLLLFAVLLGGLIAGASAADKTVAALQQATKETPWVNSLGMKFVPVKGTSVLFCIWETRIQDFAAFVKDTGHDATTDMVSVHADGLKKGVDTWDRPGFKQGPTHPVCGVSWEDAQAFCRWLTKKERAEGRLTATQEYRLPTDTEWSVAVGLGKETGETPAEKNRKIEDVYPWGIQWPPPRRAGNYAGEELKVDVSADVPVIDGYNDGYPRTSPVGSFAANSFGLFDMSGNLREWCEDVYQPGKLVRLSRGGSWGDGARCVLQSSFRDDCPPDVRDVFCGFRCVLAGSTSSFR